MEMRLRKDDAHFKINYFLYFDWPLVEMARNAPITDHMNRAHRSVNQNDKTPMYCCDNDKHMAIYDAESTAPRACTNRY